MLLQEEREIVREYGIIERQLKKRQWGQAIRLEVEAGMDKRLLKKLRQELKIKEEDIVIIDLDGNIVDGKRKPSIEHIMHRYYYKYRDDIPEKYDDRPVYGIGMEDNPDADTLPPKRLVIVLSENEKEES